MNVNNKKIKFYKSKQIQQINECFFGFCFELYLCFVLFCFAFWCVNTKVQKIKYQKRQELKSNYNHRFN